ncbi:MAG: hypothetical protein JW936_03665 [Sedimentisphaerales bacterium]|nr:hypothetical protein [Sedimentisphaerales bacterium]
MKEIWQGFKEYVCGLSPIRLVVLGYLSYVMVGWIFLAIPWVHRTPGISSLDALFTATSAMSTTGLVTVSTGNDFNLGGQVIILLLIQLGGVGYMTFGSFVILSQSRALSERRQKIGETVFSMPDGFRIDKFIKSVIVFTVIIESLGAVALFFALSEASVGVRLWSAIFHSVSAFCTAGFSLYDTSFEAWRGNVAINVILGVLSYLGAIGFIVFVDVWRRVINKTSAITLTSRLIIVTTAWVSLAAIFLFFTGEPTIRGLAVHERLLTAVFQVMTSITTVGFNTIPIGGISQASLFLIILLMTIGASPSGTGGGLKTTTFTALFGVIKSGLTGKDDISFWGKKIPEKRIKVAMASLGFYAGALIVGCYLLALTESFAFEGLLFECASALGTVGLSTGITSQLSPMGKIIITVLMFLGRLGPLTFGVALFLPSRIVVRSGAEDEPELEDIAI